MVPSILNFSFQILHVWSKFFLYSQSICSFTHWWNHLVHPQTMWRNITLDWACHSRLYCRKSQQGKTDGSIPHPSVTRRVVWSKCRCFHAEQCDQRTITLGTMIFGAVFKQLLNRYCTYNLGSWYWTDWTHNHKTLKEIIESHVCRAHYPSPRIFSTEISWQIFRKAEDPCYAQQRCMGYSCKNHGRRVASGNLIIPKRWSRRLWFATLMTHIERIFFFEIPWN